MAGHGWVTPNPDGVKARCGGPAMCKVCQAEAQTLTLRRMSAEPVVDIGLPRQPGAGHEMLGDEDLTPWLSPS